VQKNREENRPMSHQIPRYSMLSIEEFEVTQHAWWYHYHDVEKDNN